jgi:hypothetical protein
MPPMQKQYLPTEDGHDYCRNLSRHHKSHGKDHLVEQKKASAPLRLCQLADVCGGNRHFPAHPDSLHQPAGEQRGKIS